MREQVIFESTPVKTLKEKRRDVIRRVNGTEIPGFRLTNRDIEIVKAVYTYRALTTPQIETLLFPPEGKQDHPTKTTRCQYRLKLLFHAGYLFRDEQPQKLSEGRKPLLYFLDEKGAQLVAMSQGVPRSQIDWRAKDNRVSPMFLEHLLATNDVRIAISLAAKRHNARLERWLDEKTLKRKAVKDYVETTWTDKDGRHHHKRQAVVPDGYFLLSLGRKRAHFFLEIDLATEPGKRWADLVRAYMRYLEKGLYEKRYRTRSLRVLTVTSGPKRLQNLKSTTEAAGGGALFWFTTLDKAGPADILTAPIWHRNRSQELHHLIDEAHLKRMPQQIAERQGVSGEICPPKESRK